MSDPIRTCESCSKFAECHSKDFDHVCEDYIVKCPLPRIGSKEWGWHPNGYAIVSTSNNYHLVDDEKNQMWLIYDVDSVLAATSRNQPEAQNIAELLTRRDWRRENRGKKC